MTTSSTKEAHPIYGSPRDLDIRPLSGLMDFRRWPMYLRCPIISLAKFPPCVITNTSDFKQTRKSRAAKLVTCFLKPSNSGFVASSSFVTYYICQNIILMKNKKNKQYIDINKTKWQQWKNSRTFLGSLTQNNSPHVSFKDDQSSRK